MKQLIIKIPAMIAMLISLGSFFWYVLSYVDAAYGELWVLSIIMALVSLPFFFIDAIISFIRAIKKDDSKFNYILALLLVGAIPMFWFFGDNGVDLFNAIWNVYYLVIFVLEVISIKKACAVLKANRKKAKESNEK